MENLQENFDCFTDENGNIEDIWSNVATPKKCACQTKEQKLQSGITILTPILCDEHKQAIAEYTKGR
jgi:hypothetical protein